MDEAALAEATTEELGEALGQIHALMSATHATLLELVLVCDERKTWVEDGAASLESWLATQVGIAWRTAAQYVRVARTLEERPTISQKFFAGALSWDKVRALVVFTTPEDESEWAEKATWTTTATLEREARKAKERSEAEAAAADKRRDLRFRPHPTLPVTRILAWAPNDIAKTIQTAIDREAADVPINPVTGMFDDFGTRRLDALHKISAQALGGVEGSERAAVVVHEAGDGSMTYSDGTAMPDSVAERFRCDGREQHADGSVSEVVSRVLRRRILQRDGGCTFPNCENKRWLHIHHVIWRSRRGPTADWNLRATCGFHHRLIHSEGWRLAWDEHGELHYFRPDGYEVKPKPPSPLRPEVRSHLNDWLPFTDSDPPTRLRRRGL
jgi:hypothetical protein